MIINPVTVTAATSTSPLSETNRDAQFIDLLRAFRRSGGLARHSEVVERQTACRSSVRPAHRAHGTVICFEWESRLWLPWFQFDRAQMTLRSGPASVIAELAPIFKSWDLALWFARTNLWLEDARPIDLIDECLATVFSAARSDRLIEEGARFRGEQHHGPRPTN